MAKTGEELAQEALATVQNSTNEVEQSQQIAETLAALQAVIERNARELLEVNETLKQKREMLKSNLESYVELSEAEAKMKSVSDEVKQQKAKINASPEMVNLKLEIAEINQNKKDIEETLSSHLVNYHQLTGSTSFDTSDGDQWEFRIQAKVKARK